MASARAWPEADQLFRRDPRWRGSDDAYTVALGDDRTLWLFGDTFLTTDGEPRRDAAMVSNTVGLQRGLDPVTATIELYPLDASRGALFAPARPDEWWWPYDGVRAGDGVLMFFMRVRSTLPELGSFDAAWEQAGSLGFFEVVGAAAVRVPDVDRPVDDWTWDEVELPPVPDGVVLGAAVVADAGYVCAFGYRAGSGVLARWPMDVAATGRLVTPEWWTSNGWAAGDVQPAVVVSDVPTEFTVHRDDRGYVLTQIGDPFRGEVQQRRAPALTGPWSEPVDVGRAPEADGADVICYAAKAHPELEAGGALAVTYASIGMTRDRTLDDESIYYPKFLRVDVP